MRRTIEYFKAARESEDHVEFKKGEGGNVSYNGAKKEKVADRRRCILGYVTALCNMQGGDLVIGMHDSYPHKVIGTSQSINAIGQLESDIFRDTGIKVDVYELYEEEKRVLVINVPSRPRGRVYTFEDVPLMRVGEELLPMSPEVFLSIIQEQEPDFSEQFCEGVEIDDLDKDAIKVMKKKYSTKQKNPGFTALPDEQALSDLGLVLMGKVTNAAVILLGKEDVLNRVFPQAKISLEYRTKESNIHFENRAFFGQPYFLLADKLWDTINGRNGSIPVRSGMFKDYEIPLFNEDVIREAVNNAVAHRDYRINSETVIKQYPTKMEIINSGGFPHGVTIDNILTVPSTPRNRLLADILSKTGLVERSGQGVDNIFLSTIAEGKPTPDYSGSNDFYVSLVLSAQIEDIAFPQFIKGIQDSLPEDNKLSVIDVISLNNIRLGKKRDCFDKAIISKHLKAGYIEQRGKTSGTYYILGKDYYELAGKMTDYNNASTWDESQVLSMMAPYLNIHPQARMGEFAELFAGHLSRKQIRSYVDKLVEAGFLEFSGEKTQRHYSLSKKYKEQQALIHTALEIGLNEIDKIRKGQEKVTK